MIASFTNIELGTLYLIPFDQAELSDGWNTRIPPSASSKHVSVYIFKVSKHKTNQTFLFAPTTKKRHIPDLALARAANDPSVLTVTKEVPTRAFSWLNAPFNALTLKTQLRHYAKTLVGAFNQEKALSVIVKTNESFAALSGSSSGGINSYSYSAWMLGISTFPPNPLIVTRRGFCSQIALS